eukprot:SAG11_NODE_13133_length_668_cov_1.530756_1_plen_30_part_10
MQVKRKFSGLVRDMRQAAPAGGAPQVAKNQ